MALDQKTLEKDVEKNEVHKPSPISGKPVPGNLVPDQIANVNGQRTKLVKDDLKFAMTEEAKRTKDILWSQPLIHFVVPLEGGEKAGQAEEVVMINGYRLTIKKGIVVKIPEQIAQMLADLHRINMGDVGSDKRLDRDEKVMDALS